MSTLQPASSDRRQFSRSVVGMPLQAVLRDAPQDHPNRVVGLHVLNLSRGGVGVASQAALPPSQPLILFFPPVGPGKGRDTVGQVVRCDACGDHYAIGIAFEEPWPELEESATN